MNQILSRLVVRRRCRIQKNQSTESPYSSGPSRLSGVQVADDVANVIEAAGVPTKLWNRCRTIAVDGLGGGRQEGGGGGGSGQKSHVGGVVSFHFFY